MPNLTYSVADFLPFTKIVSADVNARFNDIKTLLNTTKLDDTNLQDAGITRADKLKAGTADYVVINDADGKMSEEAQLALSRGGLGFSPSLSGNGGLAVVVNDAENALALGSPIQAALTQSFSNDVSSLTAGEAISARDAVCLGVAKDSSNNDIYKVFRCDADLPTRRNNFIGFAVNAATVTPHIQTWTNSAALVSGNTVTWSVNGRLYSQDFSSDNDTTLAAIASQLLGDPDIQSAVVIDSGSNDRAITITGEGALQINVTGATVTGGASQATITLSTTQAPVGQNVRIRNFGDMSGFSSLTACSNYYLSSTAGGITNTPTDTAPIFVGIALSDTVLFVNINPANYQFQTSEILVKAKGATQNASSSANADSEHFNFNSWSFGATDSVSYGRMQTSNGVLGGYLYTVGGSNSGGSYNDSNRVYNKASWASGTASGLAASSRSAHPLNNTLCFAGGAISGGETNRIDNFTGSSWSTNVAQLSSTSYSIAAFPYGGQISFCGGTDSGTSAYTQHVRYNGVSKTTTTAVPAGGAYCAGAQTPGSKGIIWSKANGSTDAYEWNGSWSSAITVGATNYANETNLGAASGFSASINYTYSNGGSTGSSTPIATSQKYNGTSWASATSSTNARMGACAGVF